MFSHPSERTIIVDEGEQLVRCPDFRKRKAKVSAPSKWLIFDPVVSTTIWTNPMLAIKELDAIALPIPDPLKIIQEIGHICDIA
jgi:hypothetical protein